ncbi:hypothetical protein EG68_09748 [Paragonimus skrjabini miyazakii]|uniref:Secreted protein n=1 Tax=Paragonimus skrjabini miyazakii TaxID=59628 RepID=A0A8S9YIM9_9TREM|nr:hypothetical protein EG68_09748 [Paragonimus skrjabini miyazakii]
MRNECRALMMLIWCYVSLSVNSASTGTANNQNNEFGLSLWSKCKTNYLDECSPEKMNGMREEFLLGVEEASDVTLCNNFDLGASLEICYIFYLRCSTKQDEARDFKNEQKRILQYPYPWLPRFSAAN